MWKKIIAVLALLTLFALVFNCTVHKYKMKINDAVIGNIDLSETEDGEYYGQYDAYFVSAKVKVTVKDHKIIEIEIIEHDTGRGKPGEQVIGSVIEKQSLKVDTITGATASSKVILKAIEFAVTGEIDE